MAYDFGVKETMLRGLEADALVTVVPADVPADDALALEPDGVFLSNGPGDPAALSAQVGIIADLLGRVPRVRDLSRTSASGRGRGSDGPSSCPSVTTAETTP